MVEIIIVCLVGILIALRSCYAVLFTYPKKFRPKHVCPLPTYDEAYVDALSLPVEVAGHGVLQAVVGGQLHEPLAGLVVDLDVRHHLPARAELPQGVDVGSLGEVAAEGRVEYVEVDVPEIDR